MASLLSSDISGRNFKRKDPLVEHMEDCERMGIEVVPPDVNASEADFSVADGKIHFALSAIKACGGSTAISIEAERKKNGPFKDLFDFCERVDPGACNKAAIETLIKAGAMDSFGAKRSQLAAVIERALQAGASVQADKKSGQASLFDAFGDEEDTTAADATAALPDVEEWPEREKLIAEKEVLGFYLDSHPLAEFEPKLASFRTHTTDRLTDVKDRGIVIRGRHDQLDQIRPYQERQSRCALEVCQLRPGRHAGLGPLHHVAQTIRRLRRSSPTRCDCAGQRLNAIAAVVATKPT